MPAFDGPIPGENFTSDTKNYPWHRPPKYTDVDTAIEESIKRLTRKKTAFGILSMLDAGADVATVVDILLTSGIGSGKWTPDFALLLAGPFARIIMLMADGYGVKYDLGIDDDAPLATKDFFERAMELSEEKVADVAEDVSEILSVAPSAPKKGGFMGSPSSTASKETQASMLGQEELI